MSEPYAGWHCVLIEDETPEGWPVRCLPHGVLGVYPDHGQAFRAALDHDYSHGGQAWL